MEIVTEKVQSPALDPTVLPRPDGSAERTVRVSAEPREVSADTRVSGDPIAVPVPAPSPESGGVEKGVRGEKIPIPEVRRFTDEESNRAERASDEKSPAEKAAGDQEVRRIRPKGTLLQFQVVEEENEGSGEVDKEVVVYILDRLTGEIIRRVPPEEFFDPYRKNEFHKLG
jgi:uncharacterized FlaG/YvyC family protein